MATVNFSVPSDVKEAFDKAFSRQNKSAVLTESMRQAVDERRRCRRRARVVEKLLALRNGPDESLIVRFERPGDAEGREDGRPRCQRDR